ncbi:type VI secretion system baseplate subunit TssK [Aporhodopirellula aestuarii]|uniref:Type VI secretion system baseplate subunit TssK n=1 Tax=Aporhodopirellula aestuarii TaxID=2950107 RepID=A0ABT0TZ52_9BACT|nr:type VI secretion system baseplate subunit TssK [Aporhodopirellula aestuarii]MCM2369884.1 type VI secretion system baseplate subunit TssK [Aporhodopirellula aestuarii]
MKNLPVHWYEGLFLRPQHFQATERFHHEQNRLTHDWESPYGYGLHAVKFSEDALSNHQLEIHHLEARMRDGTLVTFSDGNEPDRVDLKNEVAAQHHVVAELADAFEVENTIRVYLAVPRLKIGQSNIDTSGASSDSRYREMKLAVDDENREAAAQDVQFREINAKIVLSTHDLSGFELLPIAQLKRASEGEASPQLDHSYIPPLLSIKAWPGLGRDIVRGIYDIIGQKIDVLSQQIINRGVGRDTREPGDADRISMLEKLNEAHGLLSILAFAEGVHPLQAYSELCRILGSLAIFRPERCLREYPRYDHEDLVRIFTWVKIEIEKIIHSVQDYQFEQRYFEGVGMGMQVSLEPRWFHSDWQWYVGVAKGDLTESECRDLLSPGQLDWKFGSSRQVEILFKRRAEGVKLEPVSRAIRALPARQDWVYYQVLQDGAPAWRDVQQTQSLAIRLKDSLIMNSDKLQGERQIVVSAFGRKVPLEFALFAVPSES